MAFLTFFPNLPATNSDSHRGFGHDFPRLRRRFFSAQGLSADNQEQPDNKKAAANRLEKCFFMTLGFLKFHIHNCRKANFFHQSYMIFSDLTRVINHFLTCNSANIRVKCGTVNNRGINHARQPRHCRPNFVPNLQPAKLS